jgi:hypothetical protein
MNMKKALTNFICFGSVFYTAITAVILIIATSLAEEEAVRLVEIPQFLKILLFSFILSLGSTLIRIDAIPRVAAVCAHAGCYNIGWLTFMALCGASFTMIAISTLAFAIIYTIVTILIRKVGKKAAARQTSKEINAPQKQKTVKNGYTSQFH